MDWWRSSAGVAGLLVLPLCCAVLLLLPLQSAQAWSLAATATPASDSAWSPVVAGSASTVASKAATTKTKSFGRQLNQISPYLDLALCPIRAEPWSCARQKTARVLDLWDDELQVQWQKLKVEADRQMNATIERRGYSASEFPIKEKPSTLLKKIEIGTKYMKEYLAETMDGFLGREYEHLKSPKEASDDSENDADDDDDAETEGEGDGENDEEEGDAENDAETDAADSGETGDEEEEEEEENDGSNTGEQETTDDEEDEEDEESDNENVPIVTSLNAVQSKPVDSVKNTVFNENNDSAVEFIELEDGEENATGAVKKPGHGGGGGKRKKNKTKRKKKGQQQQPATLVVVQQAPEHHEVDESVSHGHGHGGGGGHGGGHGGGIKKRRQKQKMKRGKRKRKGQHAQAEVDTDHDDLGLELLDDLVSSGIGGGGKRKHINYGRSNGVTRGKKKKKRKAFAKLALAGTLIKAKIELLLKILGAHLQIKFFAIALIGLLINIARFWIDVKRGGTPSKVVYVEHAHHQHHYEDHGEDWGEQGSYWKRSLQTDPSIEDSDSATDSYQLRQYASQRESQQQPQDAHYLAYRNQYQWQ